MAEEKISQEFKLKNIGDTRNYFIGEQNENELMSNNFKKVCTALNYFEKLFILASAVTGCVSVSAFASLFGTPIGITSFGVGFVQ